MSDIFLSYSDRVTDRDVAAKLVAVLKQAHWTVWRDSFPFSGGSPTSRETELEEAKVVIVLWSQHADSWVRRTLKHAGVDRLVPVLLDKTELPAKLPFHVGFDFSSWDGRTDGLIWKHGLPKLLQRIHAIVNASLLSAATPVSFEELSLSKIQESARLGIQESIGSRPEDETRFSGVFISYRRVEAKAHAKWFYDRLAAHFGREKVFLDLENVGLGKNFVKAITSASESCSVMVALIGQQWLRSADGQSGFDDFVRLEVATALGRNIDVIPILLPGASMPSKKDLPEDLAPFAYNNALPLSENRWERDVEDLIKSLEHLLNK